MNNEYEYEILPITQDKENIELSSKIHAQAEKETEALSNHEEMKILPMTDIYVDDSFNCRGKIQPLEVIELAQNIRAHGLLHAVHVVPYNNPNFDFSYKLIAGFCRYLAHKVNESETIKCIVEYDVKPDSADAIVFNLQENLHRRNLSIGQEARTVAALRKYGISEGEMSERLSQSRGWIQIRVIFLKLPEVIQPEVDAGVISQPQMRSLYTTLKKEGPNACIQQAKIMREAKLKKDINLEKQLHKPKAEAKRQRKKAEILALMDHLRETISNGFHTRVLAWACGNISDQEVYQSVKEYADSKDIDYFSPIPLEIPEEEFDPFSISGIRNR